GIKNRLQMDPWSTRKKFMFWGSILLVLDQGAFMDRLMPFLPMMSIWLVDKLFYLPFAWFVLQALMSIGWVNNIVARRTGLVQSLTALGISVRPVIGVAVQGPGVQPPGPAAPAAPQGEVRPFNLRRINPNRVVA